MAALQAKLRSLHDEVLTLDGLERYFGAAPMSLHIRSKVMESDGRTDHLVLFKYDQVKTDFRHEEFGPICKEARGIILRMGTWDIVCYPFDKFFNATECAADHMDWVDSAVQEKLDGSLIKVWYNALLEEWVISTNGMIDARDNGSHHGISSNNGQSYHDMFCECAMASGFDYGRLDTTRTYCFELLHPYNTVVIEHPRPRLVHIGTRDNSTLLEWPDDDIGVEKPQTYSLPTLEACQLAAAVLPSNCEGYVVSERHKDGKIHRVKIKSPTYVALHHCVGKAITSPEIAAARVFLVGEQDELEAYRSHPAVGKYFDKLVEIQDKLDIELERSEVVWNEVVDPAQTEGPQFIKHSAKEFNQALRSGKITKTMFTIFMKRARCLQSTGSAPPLDCVLVREHFTSTEKGVRLFLDFLKSSASVGGG